MKRIVGMLVAMLLVIAACGNKPQPLPEGSIEPAATRANGELLVVTGDELDQIARFDPVTAEVLLIDAPDLPDDADTSPRRAVVGPGGEHTLIDTGDALWQWSRSSDGTELIGYNVGHLTGTPHDEPLLVLAEVSDGLHLIDLRSGRDLALGLGPADPAGARLSVDRAGQVAFVAFNFGGGLAIDLETGASVELDDELLFPQSAMSADGRVVAIAGGGELGATLLVGDPLEPSTLAVRYEPAAQERQVAVAWAGDTLVGVDLEGRVLVLTEDGPEQIGALRNGGIAPSSLLSDPLSQAVLVEERDTEGGSRWFRVDPGSTAGAVTELDSVAGLDRVPYGIQPSHVLVGTGHLENGYSRLVAVPIAEGEPAELAPLDRDATVAISPLGTSVVAITDFDARSMSLFELDGTFLGEHPDIGRSVLSPDGTHVARGLLDGQQATMSITPIDGPAPGTATHPFIPLAWLPAA